MKHLTRLALVAMCCAACDKPESAGDRAPAASPDSPNDAVAEALAIADEYVAGYYEEFPEEAYETGYPAALDRMGNHGPVERAAWQAREDAWLARLQAIDQV